MEYEEDIHITLHGDYKEEFFTNLKKTNIFFEEKKKEKYLIYKLEEGSEQRIYIYDKFKEEHQKDIVYFIEPKSLKSINDFLDEHDFKTFLVLSKKSNLKNEPMDEIKRFTKKYKGGISTYNLTNLVDYDRFIKDSINKFLQKKNNTDKYFNVILKYKNSDMIFTYEKESEKEESEKEESEKEENENDGNDYEIEINEKDYGYICILM